MTDWTISLENSRVEVFSSENHPLMAVKGFMKTPQTAVDCACLQIFAKVTPQYPGVRAPVPPDVCASWLEVLTPALDEVFGQAPHGYQIQAWFSIVTTPASTLIPMQRFPHVDGTDPRQLAMMLYLHTTDHGGTGFFRHRSTGFESLTDANFPRYRAALEEDVRQSGLPPAAYASDGAPHFERIHASEGSFNEAIFYRGNLLHSGMISNAADLSPDPRKGRLTINAFFRPISEA